MVSTMQVHVEDEKEEKKLWTMEKIMEEEEVLIRRRKKWKKCRRCPITSPTDQFLYL